MLPINFIVVGQLPLYVFGLALKLTVLIRDRILAGMACGLGVGIFFSAKADARQAILLLTWVILDAVSVKPRPMDLQVK